MGCGEIDEKKLTAFNGGMKMATDMQGAKPLVSVIIPTRNRAGLLQGAIGSVFNQDGRGDLFDLEVIVVDDASSDNTREVVERYPSVRYLKLETRGKMSAARNLGIKASRGMYIAFLDDDDLWLPHRLRVQVPILGKSPEIGVVYGQGLAVNQQGHVEVWPSSGASGRVFESFLGQTDDFVNIDTWLVRREAFDAAGLFDESLPTMEHTDMALRLSFYVDWRFVPGAMCYGRLSDRGMWVTNMLNGNNDRILTRVVEKALALLPSGEQLDEVRRTARASVVATMAAQLWHYGGASTVRDYLLTAIRKYPWMLEEPAVALHAYRLARDSGAHSKAPVEEIRALWESFVATAEKAGWSGREKRRKLYGALLTQAAAGLRESGLFRRAALVRIYAYSQDISIIPQQLKAALGSLPGRGRRIFPVWLCLLVTSVQ